MKIAVVAYKFGTEEEIGQHLGTYHYFIEKLRRLVKLGHEVYVIAPWLSMLRRGSLDVSGIKVLRYFPPSVNNPKIFPINRLINFWYTKATQRAILRLNGEKDLAVVYVWQSRLTGYAIAKIKSQLRAPFIFRQITAWKWHFDRESSEVYGQRVWYKVFKKINLVSFVDVVLDRIFLEKKLQQKYMRRIYDFADRVVFVSQAAAEEGKSLGLSPEKVAIIGVGIETDLFRPIGTKTEWRKKLAIRGHKILLFIGRINFEEKGIGYLLEAMPAIINILPDVNLVVIGGGEWARMQKLIERLNIGDHVQTVGKKPLFDLPKYLNAADVFVMPSVWLEHFGQVTIEAMACGVPVVGTKIGGTAEINIHGETGINVEAADTKGLAAATIRLLQDADLREQMGRAARKRVETNFTYEVLINKFLELVKSAKKS